MTVERKGLPAGAMEKLAELLNGGRLAEGEALALRLLELDNGSGALWKLYGLARTLQGKESVRELTEAARLLPEDADAHFLLGSACKAAGQLDPAARAFGAAIELRPGLVQAHAARAAVLVELGQLDAAVAQYRRAADLAPDSAEIRSNLGNLLLRTHQVEAAVAEFREAVRVAPRSAAACTNLGNALRELGELDDAQQVLRQAIAIEPTLAAAHHGLGSILLERGMSADAEACFRKVVELEPRFLAGYTGLAMALRQRGRKRDAEAACRRALDLDPASPAALALLADFVGDRTEYAEAERLLRKALELEPDMPEALAALVRYRRMGPGDEGWLQAAQRLFARRLAPRQEVALRFAAGKFHDDRGEAAAAFAQFKRGNELRRRTVQPHDAARQRALVDGRIARYTRESIAAWPQRERSANPPLFAVGMPRSGASLVAQMLDAHPQARSAGELQYWVGAAAEVEAGSPATDYGARYLKLLARRDPKARHMVDSMPANFLNLGLIHACLPEARFIHVRRHPGDNCLAVYCQNFTNNLAWASDLGDIAAFHRQYQRAMAHWRSVLPAGTLLEVDFEDLAQDAEPAMRRVLDFVGLPWDEACLRFHRLRDGEGEGRRWEMAAPIGALEVGRWRRYSEYLGPVLELLPAAGAAGQ